MNSEEFAGLEARLNEQDQRLLKLDLTGSEVERERSAMLLGVAQALAEVALRATRTQRPRQKTPNEWLTECAVLNRMSHNRQADRMLLDRSTYYELKAGRRVSEVTLAKAALYLTEHGVPCCASELKPV